MYYTYYNTLFKLITMSDLSHLHFATEEEEYNTYYKYFLDDTHDKKPYSYKYVTGKVFRNEIFGPFNSYVEEQIKDIIDEFKTNVLPVVSIGDKIKLINSCVFLPEHKSIDEFNGLVFLKNDITTAMTGSDGEAETFAGLFENAVVEILEIIDFKQTEKFNVYQSKIDYSDNINFYKQSYAVMEFNSPSKTHIYKVKIINFGHSEYDDHEHFTFPIADEPDNTGGYIQKNGIVGYICAPSSILDSYEYKLYDHISRNWSFFKKTQTLNFKDSHSWKTTE